MSYILFLEVVLRGGILALAETADPDLDAQVYITLLSKLRNIYELAVCVLYIQYNLGHVLDPKIQPKIPY